jgi:ketosteroid isomerase-like protein
VLKLNRQELIDLVAKQFFDSMAEKRLDDMMAAVAENCTFTIYPARDHAADRDGIRAIYQAIFDNYPKLWHDNFDWVVDEAAQRVAISFDARLTDPEGEVTERRNSRFSAISDGKISEMNLYLCASASIVDVGS